MKRILLLALLAFAQFASAQNKYSWDLPKSGPAVDVIVRFKLPPTKNDLKLLGPYGQIKKSLDAINGVHVSLTPAMIDLLSKLPVIEYITPDRKLKGALDVTTATVGAQLAWQTGWTGAGVGVAVTDS